MLWLGPFLQTNKPIGKLGIEENSKQVFEWCQQFANLCSWPIAEIVDADINTHLSFAHKRTAELSLARVVLAAIDPQEKLTTK